MACSWRFVGGRLLPLVRWLFCHVLSRVPKGQVGSKRARGTSQGGPGGGVPTVQVSHGESRTGDARTPHQDPSIKLEEARCSHALRTRSSHGFCIGKSLLLCKPTAPAHASVPAGTGGAGAGAQGPGKSPVANPCEPASQTREASEAGPLVAWPSECRTERCDRDVSHQRCTTHQRPASTSPMTIITCHSTMHMFPHAHKQVPQSDVSDSGL